MAEFKVTEEFDADVAALKAAGFNVYMDTDSAKVKDITAMKTASQFARQHQAIKQIIESYAKLLEKEADDLRSMAEEARELDRRLFGTVVEDGNGGFR